MIWVIGDIHGLFDPLKKVMAQIRVIESQTGDKVEKIIFIGDYIDHGPSSREVIDLVRGLEYPTVALMGNHEDMAVRTIRPDPFFMEKYPTGWAQNGSRETLLSFAGPGGAEIGPMMERLGLDSLSFTERPKPMPKIDLPARYARFLAGLRYTHREIIRVRSRAVPFTFMHGLPKPFMSLAEQRRLSTYRLFSGNIWRFADAKYPDAKYSHRGKPSRATLDSTFIWGRDYDFVKGYGGEVIVHGHTPTIAYPEYFTFPEKDQKPLWDQFSVFPRDRRPPFIFSRCPGAGLSPARHPDRSPMPASYRHLMWRDDTHFRYDTGGKRGIEAINVDTGASAGGSLTALGLSKRCLAAGFLLFLSCPAAEKWRDRMPYATLGSIGFTRLGGPPAAEEPGPPAERRKPRRPKRPAP
jgi:hypothetical protein